MALSENHDSGSHHGGERVRTNNGQGIFSAYSVKIGMSLGRKDLGLEPGARAERIWGWAGVGQGRG